MSYMDADILYTRAITHLREGVARIEALKREQQSFYMIVSCSMEYEAQAAGFAAVGLIQEIEREAFSALIRETVFSDASGSSLIRFAGKD